MIPLYTSQQYDTAGIHDLLTLRCIDCKKPFKVEKNSIKRSYADPIKHPCTRCKKCTRLFHSKPPILVSCKQCNKKFYKDQSDYKKTKNHFCSSSCSATYSNTHKTKGIRRSKLEQWLEEQLLLKYTSLSFDFNKKDKINSELDIYIPSLRLAFELNGIFHYEPIFGDSKLIKIQNNDVRKFQACIENKINLCIIDCSSMKYFKPASAQKYLDIITRIIDENLSQR